MTYSIVYASQTGNTKMLAEALRDALPAADCLYFGTPDASALAAERIYIGFWTDKGSADAITSEFLSSLTTQDVFLFGTCGFGGDATYFSRILDNVSAKIPQGVHLCGRYMCQGKMPQSVRDRYERLAADDPQKAPQMANMIANFDAALSHPNDADVQGLLDVVCAL